MERFLIYAWALGGIFALAGAGMGVLHKASLRKTWEAAKMGLYSGMGVAVTIYTVLWLMGGGR